MRLQAINESLLNVLQKFELIQVRVIMQERRALFISDILLRKLEADWPTESEELYLTSYSQV